MDGIKTVRDEPVTRSVQGEIRVSAKRKGRSREVELWLLNDITNQNNWRYENIERNAAQFGDTPILVAYVGKKICDGHNFEEVKTQNGEVVASFMDATAERIVGRFRTENDIRVEKKDGKTWIVGKGYIWEWYARELVEKLDKQGLSGLPVSIETLVFEYYIENGVEVFTEYEILGTTILGEEVSPAVKGANIRALSSLGAKKIKEIVVRVASKQEANEKSANKKFKGERPTMKLKEVENLFPNSVVLAVEGDNAVLLSEGNALQLATCSTKETADIKASALIENGEAKMELPIDTVIEKMNARYETLSRQVETLEEDKTALTNTLKKMQAAEKSRRKECCKATIKNRLAKINEKRAECDKLDEKMCDELLTDEKIEAYSEMEDCDGNFIGDVQAQKDVDALCVDAIIASDTAKFNASKKRYAWEEDTRTEDASTDLKKQVERLSKINS